MGLGYITVETSSDHGISASAKCFQIVCSLVHKKMLMENLEKNNFLFLLHIFGGALWIRKLT